MAIEARPPYTGNMADAPSALLAELTARQTEYLAFLSSRVSAPADAEDLLQQSLLRAGDRLHTLRDPSRLRAWFYRLLRRAIADHHARRARDEQRLGELANSVETQTPEESASCACSLGLLAGLRPEYRAMLEQVDLEDREIADVAAELGITTNNATVRLHRARRALRDALSEHCNTASARECQDCGCEP